MERFPFYRDKKVTQKLILVTARFRVISTDRSVNNRLNPQRVFNSYPHELSGGMCQRAMIAVALACKPRLLIADEPTTGLDATVRAQVVKLLQELIEEERCAMIYITHDIREMLYLAERVIVMRHGVVLESVTRDDLLTRAAERHEYTQILLSAAGVGDPHEQSNHES